MKIKLKYPVAFFRLSDAQALPIQAPREWTADADLALYHAWWKRRIANGQDDGPAPPAGHGATEAFQDLERRLVHAHNELGILLAVAIAYYRNQHETGAVSLLAQLPIATLVEVLARDNRLEFDQHEPTPAEQYAREHELECETENEIVDAYTRDIIQGALHAATEHERLVPRHTRFPGTVTLRELCQLVALLGEVANELATFCGFEDDFAEFIVRVLAANPGVEFYNSFPKDPEKQP